MKKNTNIFIIIGVIVLACWQLQGLTKRQFFELNQLKQQLDKRYGIGIPASKGSDWLDKNTEIIEQMKRLDPPTAATYQEQQDEFFVTMEEQKKAKIEQAGLEQIQ